MLRRLVFAVAVAAIAACGDPNTGVGIEVIEGHVVRVLATGDHDGAKFQRLAVQLDGSLYRGEVVELEWDGRRAERERLRLPGRSCPAHAEPRREHAHVHDLGDRSASVA